MCDIEQKTICRWQEVRGAEQPLRRGLGIVEAVRSVLQKGYTSAATSISIGITGRRWLLLATIGSYWHLMVHIASYWLLMAPNCSYCLLLAPLLLAPIDSYWLIFTPIGS
jgi:hypothetical protein